MFQNVTSLCVYRGDSNTSRHLFSDNFLLRCGRAFIYTIAQSQDLNIHTISVMFTFPEK